MRCPAIAFGLAVLGTACPSKDPVSTDTHDVASDDTAADDSAAPEDDTGEPQTHPRISFGDVRLCSDPLPAVVYEEVGEQMGIEEPHFYMGEHAENGSILIADYDLDGDLDIIVGLNGEEPILYSLNGDFLERSYLPGRDVSAQLSTADMDGDGRMDVMAGGFVPMIYLNKEGGWISERLPTSPLSDETSVTKSLHPGDLNMDGKMDLYVLMSARDVGTAAAQDFVLIGNGDGTFEVDMNQVPANIGNQKGFDVQWMDWDADGWWDVYVANELPLFFVTSDEEDEAWEGNVFFVNEGGDLRFANDDCNGCGVTHDAMGVHMGDHNRDGLPDLYVTATAKNVLLEAYPDGSYVDVGLTTGADPLGGDFSSMAWGGIFLDFNNDGYMDLSVAEGDLWHEFSIDPIIEDMPLDLLQQFPDGTYSDVSSDYGMGQMQSWRTVVAADLNDDGVLDLVASDVEFRPIILMSQGCTANGWLEVDAPMHSRVEVDAGGFIQTAWTTTHASFGGGQAPIVHFGLGDSQTVDALRVVLPGGEEVLYEEAFDARRILVVR